MNHEKRLKDGTIIVHADGGYAGLGPQLFAMYCEKWNVEISSDRGAAIAEQRFTRGQGRMRKHRVRER